MPDFLCCTWNLTLSNGETVIRDYVTPQPERVAAAALPGVIRAEPVGELVPAPTPRTDRKRTRRKATPAAQIRTERDEAADLDAAETARWSWPELLTQITRAHFEGGR